MRKLLLTAYGLCSEEIKSAFLKLVPKDFNDLKVGIISTSQPKLKEKHPKMISVKNTFHEIGFKNVEFIDIEFEDILKLKKYDVIFLNGGYPFYLIYHLKKSGADIILKELINDGKVVVGLGAGSIALGPDNAMCNYIYPEDNTFGVTDLSALNAIDIRIYPHYKEHCGLNPDLEKRILEFELEYNCKVTRLNNGQAVLVLDDAVEKIG
ncbi:Type 1 glutamine amidotransferase-like domain-containing protein [Clostridium saccharoperbutylacetonicum]